MVARLSRPRSRRLRRGRVRGSGAHRTQADSQPQRTHLGRRAWKGAQGAGVERGGDSVARRWHRRASVIRHASAQPHAVGTLAVAMVKPARLAALMPHSRCSCADDTGRRAASVPAVRLASEVLAADEEQRAAPAAPEHHENVVHAQQRSPPALHRRSRLAGLPVAPRPPGGVGATLPTAPRRRSDGEGIWRSDRGWPRSSPDSRAS